MRRNDEQNGGRRKRPAVEGFDIIMGLTGKLEDDELLDTA